MNIPKNIANITAGRPFYKNNTGLSGSVVLCYDDMVLKIEKQSEESDNEYTMLSFLYGKLPVPNILCFERQNGMNYLLMSKMPGKMSCETEFLENPEVLVNALADGMKKLWATDISGCPTNSLLEQKLWQAEYRVNNNLCSMEDAQPQTYGKNGFSSPAHLLSWLKENKPAETPVLSHGDFCLPNVFIFNNSFGGFIDLGRCGIGDKYNDIAICYRSLKKNFDGSYGNKIYENFNPDILFKALDIIKNTELINYYILLDELF